MSLKWYNWGKYLPRPIRTLVRSLINRYFELRSYPLAGVLTGCRMRGEFLISYREGTYVPEVCRIIVRNVQLGWVCVDVGAHIGYFTLLLAKLVGEHGRVIAFEAHPKNAERLCSNVKINGYEARVQVENMAVSDGIHRWMKLFSGRKHSSFEWNIVGHDVEGNITQAELEIPATSLDAYFPLGSRVDFVKMNIEGAEAQALRGMRRLLQKCKPLVFVEFHDKDGWNGREELFAAHYYLYSLENAKWLDSERDIQRVYHCLAVPKERLKDIRIK
jgi:FkbM family methyltransferase